MFLILGVTLFLINDKIEIFSAIIAIGISLSIGIKQFQIENDKMFKELFSHFTNKYDKKFNHELTKITASNKAVGELSSDEKFILIDYLNFCAEEYLWYTKNRIDKRVWDSWRNGMLYFLNQPIINEYVLKEKGQENSYYGLFSNIKNNLNNWI